MSYYFKKGRHYTIEKLAFCRPFISKCKGCSCPVYMSPIVEIYLRTFFITAYKEIDSHDKPHHCFAYKIEGISPPEESLER
jgi:hypothetical protein